MPTLDLTPIASRSGSTRARAAPRIPPSAPTALWTLAPTAPRLTQGPVVGSLLACDRGRPAPFSCDRHRISGIAGFRRLNLEEPTPQAVRAYRPLSRVDPHCLRPTPSGAPRIHGELHAGVSGVPRLRVPRPMRWRWSCSSVAINGTDASRDQARRVNSDHHKISNLDFCRLLAGPDSSHEPHRRCFYVRKRFRALRPGLVGSPVSADLNEIAAAVV